MYSGLKPGNGAPTTREKVIIYYQNVGAGPRTLARNLEFVVDDIRFF